MYTQQQLDFISEYGNKELKFGCNVWISKVQISQITMPDWINFHCSNNPYKTSSGVIFNAKNEEQEILGHPVEWHDVFYKLRKEGNTITISQSSDGFDILSFGKNHSPCNITLSPMDQPELIEELLKII